MSGLTNSGSGWKIGVLSSNSSLVYYIHICANTYGKGKNPYILKIWIYSRTDWTIHTWLATSLADGTIWLWSCSFRIDFRKPPLLQMRYMYCQIYPNALRDSWSWSCDIVGLLMFISLSVMPQTYQSSGFKSEWNVGTCLW